MPTTYINFHAPINGVTAQNLMAAIGQKLSSGADSFQILFSTPGGQVASGITLYNFLRALPVPVTMHNMGNVDSIGNSIFAAGGERYCCQHSTFMFHGVGMNVNGNMEEKAAREALNGILADQDRIGSILVERTHITADQAGEFFREARTIDSANALALGIVQEVKDAVIPQGADIVSLVLN